MNESQADIEKRLEHEIKIFDEFSHPNLSNELADRIAGKMKYVSSVHRWSVIASKAAIAACIGFGIIWFAFAELNISPSVLNSVIKRSFMQNGNAVAYNTIQSNIDEQIDMLYDEFDNTVSLSADTIINHGDKLDKLDEDINELTREINNG